MKKAMILLVGLMVALDISGCTNSVRSAGIKKDANGAYFESQGIPVIFSPPGPTEVATGAAIITRANAEGEYTRSMASLLKAQAEHAQTDTAVGNFSAKTKKIIGVVINDSLDKTLYFDNPDMAWTYSVRVGGYEFIPVIQAPQRINYWFAGDKKKRTVRVKKKGGEQYNEVPVDFVVRIKQ